MDGVTEAPMRALQGELGGFTYCVSEFVRVSHEVVQSKAFLREVPELAQGAKTVTGLPVQVQLLGGDPQRMAESARVAVQSGATAVDINFGCPAPTVNRHDGGATLLKSPCRIREVVAAVRQALPEEVPVSAKLRLGWDSIEDIQINARMAVEGGADWITIHARTRSQGYAPPVYWEPIGEVRRELGIPVVANGDIWTLEDFRRCRQVTGCIHFMLGRSALADPRMPGLVARELGLEAPVQSLDWPRLLRGLVRHSQGLPPSGTLTRLKQWIRIASRYGAFAYFDQLKRSVSLDEFFSILDECWQRQGLCGRL
ncbi:tRNA-dihydrouridine synthase family protein [bacterium]|nr:tRNA-dihydrouridine synthase family protein [bacterium]